MFTCCRDSFQWECDWTSRSGTRRTGHSRVLTVFYYRVLKRLRRTFGDYQRCHLWKWEWVLKLCTWNIRATVSTLTATLSNRLWDTSEYDWNEVSGVLLHPFISLLLLFLLLFCCCGWCLVLISSVVVSGLRWLIETKASDIWVSVVYILCESQIARQCRFRLSQRIIQASVFCTMLQSVLDAV